MRICSFLPSATEIVYALGLGDSLYGVSHECDFPEEAKSKPKVVRSRFDPSEYTSQEIDRLVSEMASKGERIYEVDTDLLRSIKPDLVITQELCEVCAVSYEDVEKAVVQLDMPPQLISLDPYSLGDVMRDIKTVGQYTNSTQAANNFIGVLEGKIRQVRSSVSKATKTPTVVSVEWLDPLIIAGHWVPELVEMAGGKDALAEQGAPSRRIELAELLEAQPDILILMPCGMDVDRGVQELRQIESIGDWSKLRAIQEGNVYMADAGALFSRSGPRLVDALELMTQMVHPQLFADELPTNYAMRMEDWPA